MKFVNAYRVTRSFGGHEEGGWWYDCFEPLASVPFHTDEERDRTISRFKEELQWVNEGDINSVLGGTELSIEVEDEFASYKPSEKPHYE